MTPPRRRATEVPMKPDDPHRQLAAALGRIPSGIFILTLARDRIETGMLASWVQQCSFAPPQVSVAIRRGRNIIGLLGDGTSFTINILEAAQTDMVGHFGRGFDLGEDAFAGLEVRRTAGKGPVLEEALAYLECAVVGRLPAGDHDLFLGRVVSGELLDEGQPMVHVRKNGLHY
jgi:flavin reductase (DIM6/NTAB) family NADH-FMN oxidoreductase RutF